MGSPDPARRRLSCMLRPNGVRRALDNSVDRAIATRPLYVLAFVVADALVGVVLWIAGRRLSR